MAEPIRFLKYSQINKEKWNQCVEKYADGHLYGKSYYLDIVAPKWNALVYGEYEAVFPLTHRTKYFIRYLYQPFFCQQLGLYGDENLLSDFLEEVSRKFRHVNIQLNHLNLRKNNVLPVRSNFVLDLQVDYDKIRNGYSSQTKRNLSKARKASLELMENMDLDDGVDFFISNKGSELKDLSLQDYQRFKTLSKEVKKYDEAFCIGVKYDNEIISSAIFYRSHSRIILMMMSSNQTGFQKQGTTFLIDQVIQKNLGKPVMLDFEGSQLAGLQRFYSGFGAQNEPYPTFHRSLFSFR